jgi:exonuclease III
MKLKQLDVYFVQETWLEGDVFNEIINGYHGFHHNGKLGNHNFRGVAIILSLGGPVGPVPPFFFKSGRKKKNQAPKTQKEGRTTD